MAVVAEVAGAWSTADPEVLAALDNFHVWTPEYLIKRCACWAQLLPMLSLSTTSSLQTKQRFTPSRNRLCQTVSYTQRLLEA